MRQHPFHEVTAERDRGGRPGFREGDLSGYSCGSAPELHRLRHDALASRPKGASVACLFTEEGF